jgi:adenine-specific DNA-methyltransferase
VTVQAPPRLKPLYIQNRKFIGSKYLLLPFIEAVVRSVAPGIGSVADFFAGSGVVAHRFAAQGLTVFASDNLLHNYLALRCFLGRESVDQARVANLLHELNELQPAHGYCSREYGGAYFTLHNAGRIDAIRDAIAGMDGLTGREQAFLLTSLLYAADKVANTCGQYDAYLKHLGAPPYSATGRHQVDAMVYRPLELGLPSALEEAESEVACADAGAAAAAVEVDLVYLDPPYNNRQYIDNYHVLENIARWEKPVLFGKTRKFRRDDQKSAYSRKREAARALAGLIRRLRCGHILLSYNNEGIVPDADLLAMLRERGRVEIYEQPYAVFGNGAGRSARRPIMERLFHCRVTRGPSL